MFLVDLKFPSTLWILQKTDYKTIAILSNIFYLVWNLRISIISLQWILHYKIVLQNIKISLYKHANHMTSFSSFFGSQTCFSISTDKSWKEISEVTLKELTKRLFSVGHLHIKCFQLHDTQIFSHFSLWTSILAQYYILSLNLSFPNFLFFNLLKYHLFLEIISSKNFLKLLNCS